jgi:AcrR family transcriptional regulator
MRCGFLATSISISRVSTAMQHLTHSKISTTQDADSESPSPIVPAARRRPSQKRGQVRVDALLDAADKLLLERETHDIGVYDVAHQAGVPPTSAYHFFPTQEAIFLALAERYLQKLRLAAEAPTNLENVERWPDYIEERYYVVVNFFNTHLPARKLLIGPAVGSEIKNLDLADVDRYSQGWYATMNKVFVMPYVKDPSFKFTILVAIYDGVWMSSYAKFGYITEKFAREGLAAGISYLETFLPKTIPLRDPATLGS